MTRNCLIHRETCRRAESRCPTGPAIKRRPFEMMNDVRLCQVIQGVEATVRLGPQSFRLVVLAEALKARFGADSTPDSWIRACTDNVAEIHRVACEQFRAGGDPLVIIRHFDA
jgi:hypothetical protein